MIAVRSHHGPSINCEGQRNLLWTNQLLYGCVAEPEVEKIQAICLPRSLPTANWNWWWFCGQIGNLFSQSQASPRSRAGRMEWKAWRGKSEDPWGAISHHFKMALVQHLFSRGKWALSPIRQQNGKVAEWISSCQCSGILPCVKRQANNKVIQTHFITCVRLHSLMPWVNLTCDVQSPVSV